MTTTAKEPAPNVGKPMPGPPIGLLAELTHRCPLQCPYCSNPLQLESVRNELTTDEWLRVLDEAADLGVLQIHLSGGEPASRRDLEPIVEKCANRGLYSNLITSGIGLPRERLEKLAAAGIDHVQLSMQDADSANCDRIAGYEGAHKRKLELARNVRALGLPLTLNAPVHRHNLDNLEALIALAVELGAARIEIANVQYYAWALANRAALMPTRDQVRRCLGVVQAARERLKGVLAIDFVAPDYYAKRPKPCMGGWGRGIIVVTPAGKVLPCHAAETLPGMSFENIRTHALGDIWRNSPAFNSYRGTAWMPEPCQSCELKEKDWGGCRCQALAMTGDAKATDPACDRSPFHARMVELADTESATEPPPFRYRR